MHELSLGSAIVDTAVKHADGRPVLRIHLTIGALRQVVPDSLVFYFEFVARDTVCEGATLVVEDVPARLACDGCGAEWELERASFRCARCTDAGARVVAGDEFRVESIVVDEALEEAS